MNCALIGLIVLASALGMAISTLARARGSPWNEAFKHVARRFHGVLHPGGWFRQPTAWIRHGEAQGRLSVHKLRRSSGERCLHMTIQQPEVHSRCEIFCDAARSSLVPERRGLAAVEFDWEEFRRRWHVLAGDGDEIRHLLSDGVRLAIDQLWRHPQPSEMTLSLSPGWLIVRKVWKSPRGIDLEEFVERVCTLSDQLNLSAAAGIEFVLGDEPQLLDAARCGVCGENLASDVVVCRRCNTPHHHECWKYGGGCATYGCGGRECVVPGVAPLAGPHWEGQEIGAARPLKPR